MEVFTECSFEAAHRLPRVAASHKCAEVHGHGYRLTVVVRGRVTETGWVMDFDEIESNVAGVVALLDHHYLNDIEGLDNPTCENICRWVWRKLLPNLPALGRVELRETANAGCMYDGTG